MFVTNKAKRRQEKSKPYFLGWPLLDVEAAERVLFFALLGAVSLRLR